MFAKELNLGLRPIGELHPVRRVDVVERDQHTPMATAAARVDERHESVCFEVLLKVEPLRHASTRRCRDNDSIRLGRRRQFR